MDWSAVFEDGGEEEGEWEREDIASARTGILQLLQSEGKYGPLVCYAFTVNYILGVGCLGIPYAFLQCGIVLGSILVLLLSMVSYMTVMWVAQTYQQELLMEAYLSNSNPFILSPVIKKRSPIPSNNTSMQDLHEESQHHAEHTLLKNNIYQNFGSILQNTTEKQEAKKLLKATRGKELIASKRKERNKITNNKNENNENTVQLEVTDLALEYLGPHGKLVYQISLMLLTYVGLLAYTQVFNSSFVSQIWPTAPYWLPAVLFGVVVVPLSCCDLSDQVTVQVVMSLLRFLSLGILLFGTIVAYLVDPPGVSSSDHTSGGVAPPLVQLSGFSVMFTTAIFSQLFQHSVPGLISPLTHEHRKLVPTIFKAALTTTSLIYITTGCMCVLYFGDHLQQSVNLNFVNFTWGYNYSITDDNIWNRLGAILVSSISMIVVLFPALDTLSVFPLIANTLGNNLNSAFPGLAGIVKQSNYVTERSSVRRITLVLWRLVAAIPPIILSIYVNDLIFSLQLAGLCGIVVALVTPALLQRQCEFRSALIPVSMKANSPISVEFTQKRYAVAVLVLAAVALLIAFYQMIIS